MKILKCSIENIPLTVITGDDGLPVIVSKKKIVPVSVTGVSVTGVILADGLAVMTSR
jgi:hypothetical protein